MARPRKDRMVAIRPDVIYFKPRGVPLRNLAEVRLTVDELEAIRLADWLGLDQKESGRRMGVSRATFGRIIQKARSLVADALVNGKAIRVEGGSYQVESGAAPLVCSVCDARWIALPSDPGSRTCPRCSLQTQP